MSKVFPTLSTPLFIPGLDFYSNGSGLHFAHANGFPPGSYRLLLEELAIYYHVTAMFQRPLWPSAKPQDLQDWRPLAADLDLFLSQENLSNVVGVGHSLGAINTLRLALQKPERFNAVILLDPVIFPPWVSVAWQLAIKLGLGMKIHPLAARTKKRIRYFASQEAMFEQYRAKPVFERVSDEGLRAYIEAGSRPTLGGGVELIYSPEWETQIYLTGSLADLDIWRGLRQLKPPLLIVRGEHTDTFQEKTAQQMKKHLPELQITTVPETGHLLPLEKPQTIARIILDYLGSIPG